MSKNQTIADENRLAEEILSVLPVGSVARVCSGDGDSITFTVDSVLLRLKAVSFDRQSLLRLHADPARAVKIEYLQRDLLRSALRRAEFCYPRIRRLFGKGRRINRLRAATMAVAALGR